MKKIILHIGCEKTGTTSIQNFLAKNRDSLLSEHSILFPRSLGNANHTKLAIYACNETRGLTRFLKDGQSLEAFRVAVRTDFLEEIRSCDWRVLVLSAEWFHPRIRTPEEFSRIKSLLEGVADKIEIIMYVRRQDEMAISLYSTSLKSGSYKPFKFPNVAENNLPYYYDFYSIYHNWKLAFGLGNVNVRVFDPCELHCGDVVKDFARFLSVEELHPCGSGKSNQSLSEDGVMLFRAFNHWLDMSNGEVSDNERSRIRKQISEKFSGKFNVVSEADKVEFYSFFKSSNDRLKRDVEKDLGVVLKGLG